MDAAALPYVFRPDPEASERFWAAAEKGRPRDCWPWRGRRGANGYGFFAAGGGPGRCYAAHLFAKAAQDKFCPPGMFCAHLCPNRLCVNPRHLYWSACADEAPRGAEPDRRVYGSRTSNAKLNEETAQQIYRLYHGSDLPLTVLGQRFGVDASTIRTVGVGRTWSHCTQHLEVKKQVRPGRKKRYVRKDGLAGSNNRKAKLSEQDVYRILELFHRDRYVVKDLARCYGVCESSVRQMVDGKTWKHVWARYAGPRRAAHVIGRPLASLEQAEALG